jgi:flagellar secretion chaperone FliS
VTVVTNPALRARYLSDTVATASPARLLVMLYDRLVLDLTQAEDALRGGNRPDASARLTHAQDILIELRAGLDVTAWSGGPALAQLYGYLVTELIGANVRADADRVRVSRELVEPLRDAWREAALAAAEPAPADAARIA